MGWKKMNHRLTADNQRGAVAVLVGLMLALFVGVTALAVDVGYMMVVKNELQNVADASALAACGLLGNQYGNEQPVDRAAIRQRAIDAASANRAGNVNITLLGADIEIGTWDQNRTPPFESVSANPPNAVRVITRRDASANNPITLFFARIFGIQDTPVQAFATAALTGQSAAGRGGLPVPVGISRYWFDNQPLFNFCNQPIRFYPTNDPTSCAGWHVFDRYSNFNDIGLRRTIGDLRTGTYESPEVTAGGDQFEFGGGTMSTHTFDAMLQLFQANLNRDLNNDGTLDAWEAAVPVYESSDCSNPQGEITIVGFATIVITGVQSSPVHQIDGYVLCNTFEPARGGGNNYGTMGTIPGLVQ